MFKSYLYLDDFCLAQMNGDCEHSISCQYSGICMQSNWATIKEKKQTTERLRKHCFEFVRFILRR